MGGINDGEIRQQDKQFSAFRAQGDAALAPCQQVELDLHNILARPQGLHGQHIGRGFQQGDNRLLQTVLSTFAIVVKCCNKANILRCVEAKGKTQIIVELFKRLVLRLLRTNSPR